ncbi:hypothetical protein [uncultured Desulfovibrio sp.]|uniref:hypothetical protein n=1 Tax=uncultured Desulfovibrio sp. TaxID=167968 RepID=UPI002638D6D6|nr:hypothetical protein [uncultured Desulfovibrio sp.]
MHDKEYLSAAAMAVARQLAENPVILSIPIDPDVADFMGAFVEDALGLADVIEDGLLTVNGQGEVLYEAR